MLDRPKIVDAARGRWEGILSNLGLPKIALSKKHGPCPFCGGKDRYRWTDHEAGGGFICNHCGAGNGVELVMRFKGLEFLDAVKLIEAQIGAAPIKLPKREKSEDQQRDQMKALWQMASPLDGTDIASRYLMARGIVRDPWPISLRYVRELPYWDDAKVKTLWPAMLAKFAAPDGARAILHRTYLSEPGIKAPVAKQRMIMPGKIPPGGAVRLAASAETMGIAEGLETAMSASILFDVPVWAALNCGALAKWKPPKGVTNVIVFGDRDDSHAGQYHAHALAFTLKTLGLGAEVRYPDGDEPADFNDQLMVQARERSQ